MDDEARRLFRDAMARLHAAVTVVTTAGPAGWCGITATAVCSVTDTPPTMLVCVNRSSAANAVFKANRRACINILSADQEGVARHFAGMTGLAMEERFRQDAWTADEGAAPRLPGALASLEGPINGEQEVGTHTVFFVTTGRIWVAADGDGLAYFQRQFRRVTSEAG